MTDDYYPERIYGLGVRQFDFSFAGCGLPIADWKLPSDSYLHNMSRTYVYCSAPLAMGLRFFIFGLMFAVTAFYGFGLPMWIGAVIVLAVLAIWLGMNFGWVRRNGGTVRIQSVKQTITLTPPFECDSWWHYFIAGRNTANDVHVVLHLKDVHGSEVYFSERIVIGMRHPNEVEYRDVGIPEGAVVVRVQRVDRLTEWMKNGELRVKNGLRDSKC